MSVVVWWRGLVGEDWRSDPRILSKEAAVERVRQYATLNQLQVEDPVDGVLERHPIDVRDTSKGKRPVYVFRLGDHRPMTVVEVDALTGVVIAWRTFPR